VKLEEDRLVTEVDGRQLVLTSLGKVLDPASGFFKAEVLSYYVRIPRRSSHTSPAARSPSSASPTGSRDRRPSRGGCHARRRRGSTPSRCHAAAGRRTRARSRAPLSWETVREESKGCAQEVERAHPELVVSNMRRDLRAGRVLIDWSQNMPSKITNRCGLLVAGPPRAHGVDAGHARRGGALRPHR
jgi:hypothetical protein